MSKMECSHSLFPSKLQLKKNWVIIHLWLYYFEVFACISFQIRDLVLGKKCLPKKKTKTKKPKQSHAMFLKHRTNKSIKKTKKRLSLCCQ